MAFKVSRNPSAAGGGWQCTRGFWGSGFSASLTAADFLLWALTLLWPSEAPCAAALRAGLEPVRVPGQLTRWAGPGWATQEPPLPRAQRLRRARDLGSPGSRGTNIWCAVSRELYPARATVLLLLLFPGSPPGADFAPARADFGVTSGLIRIQETRARLGYLYLRFSLRCIPLAHSP